MMKFEFAIPKQCNGYHLTTQCTSSLVSDIT